MNTLINLHSRLLGNGFGTIKHSNLQFSAMHVRSSDGYRSIEYPTYLQEGYNTVADANESF